MTSSFRLLATLVFLASTTIAAADEADCVPQTQLDVVKIDQQIVLIGETHGTNEIPAFTSGFVCSLLRAGRSVILGIEHEGNEQEALNRFLASEGTSADRRALLGSSANWQTYTDGRGSEAMYRMVDLMRHLRRGGQRVAVLAIDRNENLDVPLRDDERGPVPPADNAILNRIGNEAMAGNVLYAAILNRNFVVVVLAGYSHTSTVLSVSNHPMVMTYRPMGQVLSDRTTVFTIGIDTAGGEAAQGGTSYPVEAGPQYVPENRVDARVAIGRLTPSLPARDAREGL